MRHTLTGTVIMMAAMLFSAMGGARAWADEPSEPLFKAPPRATVAEAAAFGNFRYGRDAKGGAHTNGAWSGGRLPVLAVAAYAGDGQAVEPLLEQIRFILRGQNTPSANGGYPAQHERMFSTAIVVMKNTPKVWAMLTEAEKTKIDLLMKALLVGSAYTTSDKTYAPGVQHSAIDGDRNLNRGWNPNFREGMIGMLLVGGCYFGPDEAQQMLDTYNHDAFVKELKDAGLTNTHGTFNWKADHPDSDAPSGRQIEQHVRQFRYMGRDIKDPMRLYVGLTAHTYGATVAAGLNDGRGISGGGRIAKGAENLPNLGKVGMLYEFASNDAKGRRSSVGYAYDGFRPNLMNQIALIVSGHWKPGREAARCVELKTIGATDLFYKLENGYINYAHGRAAGSPTVITDRRHDYRITRSLWEDVVLPYHQAQAGN